MEIERLVRAAATGDQRAWRALANRLGPKLQRWFALNYREVADSDLVQDTLIVIWDKLPNFEMRHESAFMSWVFKIARFVGLAALRQQGRQRKLAKAVAPVRRTPSMGLSSRVYQLERLDMVRREVDKLPESLRRAAVNMLAGGDARELAERDGLDWGTVRGYESRAVTMLRERLEALSPPT